MLLTVTVLGFWSHPKTRSHVPTSFCLVDALDALSSPIATSPKLMLHIRVHGELEWGTISQGTCRLWFFFTSHNEKTQGESTVKTRSRLDTSRSRSRLSKITSQKQQLIFVIVSTWWAYSCSASEPVVIRDAGLKWRSYATKLVPTKLPASFYNPAYRRLDGVGDERLLPQGRVFSSFCAKPEDIDHPRVRTLYVYLLQ